MRIISGVHRGAKLASVPGKNTRPTSDKVKESLFNIIGPYFNGGNCLDLFAGSGNVGLEALSRGFERTIFIERNGLAVKTIYENIKKLKVDDKSEVLRMDVRKGLNKLGERGISFSLIFMDPPYNIRDIHIYLDLILKHNLLEENGLLIYEHDSSVSLETFENLYIARELTYGSTSITILTKNNPD